MEIEVLGWRREILENMAMDFGSLSKKTALYSFQAFFYLSDNTISLRKNAHSVSEAAHRRFSFEVDSQAPRIKISLHPSSSLF